MKICICISGQIRENTYSLKKLSENIKHLSNKHSVDTIISTWSESGSKLSGSLGYWQLTRIFEQDIVNILPSNYFGQNFWNHFPILHEKINNNKSKINDQFLLDLFPKAHIDIEEDKLNLEFREKTSDKNSIKMLYKRWRCNEIKKKIENKNGTYDLVLHTRPDLDLVFNFTEKPELKNDEIYLPTNENIINYDSLPSLRHTNDVMAYGQSHIMNIYCDLFSKSISEKKWHGIHSELFLHLKDNNIAQIKPTFVTSNGLVKSNLLGWNDVINENSFLHNIYHNKVKEEELNPYEKSAYQLGEYFKKIHYCIDKNDFLIALQLLFNSELSVTKINKEPKGKEHVLIRELGRIQLYTGMDKEELIKLSKKNSVLEENLLFLFSSNYLNDKKNILLIDMINKRKKNEIKKIKSINGLKIKIADMLKKTALEYENIDLDYAKHCMSLALQLRPRGNFIINRLEQYNEMQ